MEGLKEARDYILRAKTIAISGHVNPDGDSIGSLLSLGLGLESLGKKVFMLSQDAIPTMYKSLSGANRISKTLNKRVDLAISVDCGAQELLGRNLAVFKKARAILEIDHHEFRRPFGDIRLIDHKAPAGGELIYILLKKLNVKITKEMAENILTSIIVETNSFKLPNAMPHTFQLCAELIKTGVNFSKLADMIYWSKTKESLILLGICLSRCRFLRGGRIVWSVIRRKDLVRVGGKDYDVDTVANEMRSVKSVKIVVLFREKNKKFLRVSLRSKDEINVASIAERYKGGGHSDVAGCYILNNAKSMRELLALAEGALDDRLKKSW